MKDNSIVDDLHQIVGSIQEVYERYNWLKAKLIRRYNICYDECCTAEEILVVNAWYEKMEKYLGKRFVREFSRAVERTRQEVTA